MTAVVYTLPHANPANWEYIHHRLGAPIPDLVVLQRLAAELFSRFHQELPTHTLTGLLCAFTELEQQNPGFRFFADVLPNIQRWALEAPTLFEAATIPALPARLEGVVRLTRAQVRCILSLSFFSTLSPLRPREARHRYGELDWMRLHSGSTRVGVERLKCLLNYFWLVAQADEAVLAAEAVEFHRKVGHTPMPQWDSCPEPFLPIEVFDDKVVEASPAVVHVDFANCDLHIAQIIPSATQEEVLFSIRPDLFAGLLFCETLEDDEAIVMRGARRYNNYTGYLGTFTFAGTHHEALVADAAPAEVLAIDAIVNHGTMQFQKQWLLRDLDKAFIGFAGLDGVPAAFEPGNMRHYISTGNWGCGAFHGDHVLKFVQQAMAAAAAHRGLHYSTFGNPQLCMQLRDVSLRLAGATVADLWRVISTFLATNRRVPFHEHVLGRRQLPRPISPTLPAEDPRNAV